MQHLTLRKKVLIQLVSDLSYFKPMALHLNAVDYKICNGQSRSRDCANAVWTTSMSWSSASLMSGMVCIRTSLTRLSTSEERGWKRAYVHRDDILNNWIFEGTLVWKRLPFFFSLKIACCVLRDMWIFVFSVFQGKIVAQTRCDGENETTFRCPIVWVISLPKIIATGQFLFELSSKM